MPHKLYVNGRVLQPLEIISYKPQQARYWDPQGSSRRGGLHARSDIIHFAKGQQSVDGSAEEPIAAPHEHGLYANKQRWGSLRLSSSLKIHSATAISNRADSHAKMRLPLAIFRHHDTHKTQRNSLKHPRSVIYIALVPTTGPAWSHV